MNYLKCLEAPLPSKNNRWPNPHKSAEAFSETRLE